MKIWGSNSGIYEDASLVEWYIVSSGDYLGFGSAQCLRNVGNRLTAGMT